MKTLVSWRAASDDFVGEDGGVRPAPGGPTLLIHSRFWDYDRHVLLSTAPPEQATGEPAGVTREREQVQRLADTVRQRFPDHPVELRFLGVRDVIDFAEIRGKVESLLEGLSGDDIEVFVSPGTGTMQTAWYFAHFGLGLRTKLFKVRDAKHTRKGAPERIYEEVEQSPVPQSLTIRENTAGPAHAGGDGYVLTRSVQPVYERARRVAATDHVTALILGASGVGKEHLARYVHAESARASGRFVAINCAAWQNDQLLESRLFGHKKGAFTGAHENCPGAFEDADGGTVFLDEVGDCSPALQQSLLRVLQEREVTRLGETQPRNVDVRIVAATHRDLPELCAAGQFRWDLYYRLAVAELDLPSLDERGADEVDALLSHFVAVGQKTFRRQSPLRLTSKAQAVLAAHPFPGNVRELQHLVDQLYVFTDGTADVDDLPTRVRTPSPEVSLRLADVERRHVLAVYKKFGANKARTADALGCAVNTLKAKLRTYDVHEVE